MSEVTEVKMTSTFDWESCPIDVLMLVFKNLDMKSVAQCMHVNKWWRNVADFYADHHKLWKKIVQEHIQCDGLSCKLKHSPDLDWRNLYVNLNLWSKVDAADINCKLLLNIKEVTEKKHLFAYKSEFTSVTVYKDILIVVYEPENKMKFYKTSDNQEYKPLSTEDTDLEKSVSDDAKRMIKKIASCNSTFKKFAILNDDCFYLLDLKGILRRYIWKPKKQVWSEKVLARYYGCNSSVMDFYVFEGEVLLSLKKGIVMRLNWEGRNFEKAYYMEYPPYLVLQMLKMFSIERVPVPVVNFPACNNGQKCIYVNMNLIVSVSKDKPFKFTKSEKGYKVIQCPGLTYSLHHGTLVFLGFENGNIDILNRLEFVSGSDYKPKARYNLKSFKNALKDVYIVSMDVQESLESHHLFVATPTNLLKLEITYSKSVKDSVIILMK